MKFHLIASLSVVTMAVFAANDPNATIDPTKAGPEFFMQGEYVGEEAAAQVIAMGDGKFRAVGFEGGLPGESSSTRKMEADGVMDGKVVRFEKDGWKGVIEAGKLTVTNPEGAAVVLEQKMRQSPTLGAKPPEGGKMLFDGTEASLANWKGGKLDSEGNLSMGVKTVEEFGDFTLHLEFRTPFQPKARGQGRGNSGVYLQDRYEVQVLDSFGLKGESNECGGIYSKHRPRVNMAFPPLSWQTYDIDFTAARWDADGKKTANAKITVRHNGVLIHENVEVDRETAAAGRKDGPGKGPLQLQNHGNPVAYRNIWIVEKP